MFLQKISISGVRNLNNITLNFSPSFNLIYGKNGSGKTSLLEAIHILGTGRSFRSAFAEEYINFHSPNCIVVGHTLKSISSAPLASETGTHIGLERHKEHGVNLKLNHQKCCSIADFTKELPLQLINTEAYRLLEGSSRLRRQFFDWGLFHVEHSFFPLWQRYGRALKQRNAALKHSALKHSAGRRDSSFLAWNKEIIECGQAIDELRIGFFNSYIPILKQVIREFLHCSDLDLVYKRGWSQKMDLNVALDSSLELDMMRGFTHKGIHRADLEFRLGPSHVDTVFSRGQLKLFISALIIARGLWLFEKTGKKSVFLVDDIHSELDGDSSSWLLKQLHHMGGQVILTTIEPEMTIRALQVVLDTQMQNIQDIQQDLNQQIKMFHVEHGGVIVV